MTEETNNQTTEAPSKTEEDKEFAYGVQVQNLSEKSIIRGVLLAEGIWKGVKYNYEEFRNSAPMFLSDAKITINGKDYVPKLGDVDHKKTFKYADRTIGQLTKVIPNDMLRCLLFEAEITDPEARDDLAKGVLDSVSPSGKFEELDELSTSVPIGKNYKPLGWALTGTPACKFSTIFHYDLSTLDENSPKDIIETKDISVSSNNKESVFSMTDEQKNDSKVEDKKEESKQEDKKEDKIPAPQPVNVTVNVDEDKIIEKAVAKAKEQAKVEAKAEAKAELEAQFNAKLEEIKALIPKKEEPPAPEEPKILISSAEAAAEIICGGNKANLAKYYKKEGAK